MKTDGRMVAREESVEGGSWLVWGFICNGDRVSVPTCKGFERRTCVYVVFHNMLLGTSDLPIKNGGDGRFYVMCVLPAIKLNVFLHCWVWNSGPCPCQAGAVPLSPAPVPLQLFRKPLSHCLSGRLPWNLRCLHIDHSGSKGLRRAPAQPASSYRAQQGQGGLL